MKRICVPLLAALLAVSCSGSGVSSEDVVGEPSSTISASVPITVRSTSTALEGSQEVAEFDGEVVDNERKRTVPYRAYVPMEATGDVPVVLVSHGGFGSALGYTRAGHLGSTFAAAGFLALHVGHLPPGPGERAVFDRPADVTAVLDVLENGSLELPPEFTGSADLTRVGHVGHSFGAYTSHAVGGAVFDRDLTDPRIDAIVPISPAGHGQFGAFDDEDGNNTWSTVTIPAFNLVGGDETDTNALGSIDEPDWRLEPFRNYPDDQDRYLVVIEGQDHSDMWLTGSDEVEGFIAGEITDFLVLYVAGDTSVDACGIGVGDLGITNLERSAGTQVSFLGACS